MEEIQKNNPVDDKTHHRHHRNHQFLTKSTRLPHLDKHLASVITMMRGFDTWDEFNVSFKKSFNIKQNEDTSNTDEE